jgi:hypothetical protein
MDHFGVSENEVCEGIDWIKLARDSVTGSL